MSSGPGKSNSCEDRRYSSAFRSYLRCGLTSGMDAGLDPAGGYIAPPGLEDRIARCVSDNSALRQLARVETISCGALAIRTDSGVRDIPVHELYAQPKGTEKFVGDPNLDIEAWIAGKAADVFTREESEAFVHGTGVGMPHGILARAGRGEIEVRASGSNGEVTPQAVIDLVRRLPEEYIRNATFVMNRATVQGVRLLQDPTTSAYLWQPGLSAGAPDTLAGVPVRMVSEMPSADTGSLSVALGDFGAGYRIVDRRGVHVLRDPFSEKPFVKFFVARKVGGDVTDASAIKVLRLAA